MKIEMQERWLYGRRVYYPLDPIGKKLLKLLDNEKRKCFVASQISAMRDLGYDVEIIPFEGMP